MKELDIYGNEIEVNEVDIYGDEIEPEGIGTVKEYVPSEEEIRFVINKKKSGLSLTDGQQKTYDKYKSSDNL